MSCADPETFVWGAGYYRPYSGFAIEMAFRWLADFGPTLNADFVALRVLVDSEPVLLRNPIVLWFPMGPHTSPLEARMNVQQSREFHSYRRHP